MGTDPDAIPNRDRPRRWTSGQVARDVEVIVHDENARTDFALASDPHVAMGGDRDAGVDECALPNLEHAICTGRELGGPGDGSNADAWADRDLASILDPNATPDPRERAYRGAVTKL
jgi:hypothetical protein